MSKINLFCTLCYNYAHDSLRIACDLHNDLHKHSLLCKTLNLTVEEASTLARQVTQYCTISNNLHDKYKHYLASCFNVLKFDHPTTFLHRFYEQHGALKSIFQNLNLYDEGDVQSLTLQDYGFRMFATMPDLHRAHCGKDDTSPFTPSAIAFHALQDMQDALPQSEP